MRQFTFDLTPEQMFDILKMRSEGLGYIDIGNKLGLSYRHILIMMTRLKVHSRVNNFSLIKPISQYSGLPTRNIVIMIKQKFVNKNSANLFRVRVNETISNKNLWYNFHKGKEFEAKRKLSYYYVTDFLKIRQKDCTEIKR